MIKTLLNKLRVTVTVAAFAFAVGTTVPEAKAGDYDTLTLPFTTLTGAGSVIVSNLTAGVQTTTNLTNITYAYTNFTSVNRTNVTTQTNTTYVDFNANGQNYVPIESEWSASAGQSNVMYYVSRSTTSGRFPTNFTSTAVTIVTNATKSTTPVVCEDLIDMRGFTYGRVIFVKWDTTASDTVTNRYLAKGNKKN